MRREQTQESDKELWRRLAPSVPAGRGVVSELDFAAWLDGRLETDRTAEVAAAVSADPDLRRAAEELSELLGQPLPAAPARLAVRARNLVGFAAERRPRRAGLLEWLLAGGSRFLAQRIATLTAAVVVAISGFVLGGGLGASLAKEHHFAAVDSSGLSTGAMDQTEFLGGEGI